MLPNDTNKVWLEKPLQEEIFVGWSKFCQRLHRRLMDSKKNLVIAFDGYLGVEWDRLYELTKELENFGINYEIEDYSKLWKQPSAIWALIKDNIECDIHFGKIYSGQLEDFLDFQRLQEFKSYLISLRKQQAPKLVILYGNGVVNRFTKKFFDEVFYVDISRTEFLKKIEKHSYRFLGESKGPIRGQADVGLSLGAFKLSQYICTPIFDKHRRRLIRIMSYYVLFEDEVKIFSKASFEKICDKLSSKPFKLTPLYISGPWGGQWIKKVRNLDPSYPNCAWAFEAVTGDMCLGVNLNDSLFFKLPFVTFLSNSKQKLVGTKIFKRFGYFFPIRVHYDDSYKGGNMAIQVHPNRQYVKKYFNERVGQHEAYYIVRRKEHAGVYLGLKEHVDVNEFAYKAKESYEKKVPLDYQRYVNFIESNVGDLFLIPAGTIHALGKDQVCIEIGTSYGYTFHVYDYLRPDLNGELREIHVEHAFAALKKSRREKWVKRCLIPKAELMISQGKSKEYLLGRRRDMIFEVRRLELKPGAWYDNTGDSFHILILTKGNQVEVLFNDSKDSVLLEWSRTLIVPANVGKYAITSSQECEILKVIPYSEATTEVSKKVQKEAQISADEQLRFDFGCWGD